MLTPETLFCQRTNDAEAALPPRLSWESRALPSFPQPDFTLPVGLAKYRSTLLSWFDRSGRPLPWRSQRTLYGTWISEMMLQQTTVATVVPYWKKFLSAFPDVAALAAADEVDVLALWSGLGYYRRARNLHAAANLVVDKFGGVLPETRDQWLALPGVGPYASGAIASIGLGERVPALDANARRVLTRWLVGHPDQCASLKAGHLEVVGKDLVDPDRPGDWNEAVMELGALVCGATNPGCESCPVRSLCRAGGSGAADLIPPPQASPGVLQVRLGVLVVRCGDQILLTPPAGGYAAVPARSGKPVRADLTGLHQGLWGLPSTPWLPATAHNNTPWPAAFWRPWLERTLAHAPSLGAWKPVLLGSFSHAVTRYRLKVVVYGLHLPDSGELAREFLVPEISGPAASEGEAGCLAPRYHLWPGDEMPVSRIVTKSLQLAAKHRV